MDIAELRAFLKDNLTIHVSTGHADYYSNATRVEVSLKLDGKVISEDSFTITEGKESNYY